MKSKIWLRFSVFNKIYKKKIKLSRLEKNCNYKVNRYRTDYKWGHFFFYRFWKVHISWLLGKLRYISQVQLNEPFFLGIQIYSMSKYTYILMAIIHNQLYVTLGFVHYSFRCYICVNEFTDNHFPEDGIQS